MRGLLDSVQPRIAHVHNIYHHLSPSILPLLKERGIPVVMTLHDLKLACPAYTMMSAASRANAAAAASSTTSPCIAASKDRWRCPAW